MPAQMTPELLPHQQLNFSFPVNERVLNYWILLDQNNNFFLDRHGKISMSTTRARAIGKIKENLQTYPIVSPQNFGRTDQYRFSTVNAVGGYVDQLGVAIDGLYAVRLVNGQRTVTEMRFVSPYILPPAVTTLNTGFSSSAYAASRRNRLTISRALSKCKAALNDSIQREIHEGRIRVLQLRDLNTVLGQVGNGVAS
jgi:hypothetical protein